MRVRTEGFTLAKRALHANLRCKFGNGSFWAEGYYVSTGGLNEATVEKHMQDQGDRGIAPGKLSVKEYENPFKEQVPCHRLLVIVRFYANHKARLQTRIAARRRAGWWPCSDVGACWYGGSGKNHSR